MQKRLFPHRSGAIILFFFAFLQGLLFLWLTPPWWHYDEPGHFEFAWELAHFDHWPKPGEIDSAMRRRIARSMLHYDWYHHYPHNQWPDLSKPEIPYIGPAPQYTPYPLYYLVVSLPLRLVGGWSPANQLRLARLVSVLLLILTIGAVWGALGEILPAGHPLRWLVPVFLITLPGFLDVMTAVSDDVGAAFTGTLLLWAALRILRRGLTLRRLVALLAAGAAAFWTKNTTWPLLLAIPWAIWFGLPWRSRWVPWSAVLAMGLLALGVALRWGDAALWYRAQGIQENPSRIATSQTPLGRWAFHMAPHGASLGQWIPPWTAKKLRGQTVTIGLWLWAEKPVRISLPRVCTETGCTQTHQVHLTPQPQFFMLTTTFPTGKYPRLLLPAPQKDSNVFADGLLLAQGAFRTPPRFTSPQGKHAIWEGQEVSNALRNASAEQGWIWLNPTIQRHLAGKFPASVDLALATLLDVQGSVAQQRDILATLYCTFWGRLARNKVPLLGAPLLYYILFVFSLLGVLGALGILWQARRQLPWESLALLFFALISIWGITLFRGLGTGGAVIPWARYAVPAIFPTALLLVGGWYYGLQALTTHWGLSATQITQGLLAFFLTLSVIGWLSLLAFSLILSFIERRSVLHFFYPDNSWACILLEIPLFAVLLQAVGRWGAKLHLPRQDSHK